LAGIVDVTGRGGAVEGTDGGADVSLVSGSAWLGHGGKALSGFGAARVVHLSTISAVSSQGVPYGFQDFYGTALISGEHGPQARITAFASRDHLLDRDVGSGMDWNNLLLGARWGVMSRGSTTITTNLSASRFAEDVSDIAARRSRLDLTNRFSRLAGGGELKTGTQNSQLLLGSTVGLRKVRNRIIPLSGEDFPAADLSLDRVELSGYAEWSRVWDRIRLQAGARVDAAGSVQVLQPRARLQIPLSSTLSIGAGVGRTGRLYHLVSDPQLEADLAFYDFWLSAGEHGVPVPKVDHAAVDLNGGSGSFAWRLSAYGSKASGLAELHPSSEAIPPGGDQFRYGRGRTFGAELQIGLQSTGSRRNSFTLMYALSRSDRNWGSGWIPWSQDRRHLVRALGTVRTSRRWTIFGAFEAVSAMPLTPVDQVVWVTDLNSASAGSFGSPAYKYGTENSRRGLGTARADIGARFEFKGFGNSRAALGLSVINLGFGPVSPVSAASPIPEPGFAGEPDIVRVRYQRLFDLPAIPTVTLRMEF
jgi:hypothetical protein